MNFTLVQMNDLHGYLEQHQEHFWQGNQAVYRLAGGISRIATLVKQLRSESQEKFLFADCGDTLHGTYPAVKTQGRALIPILNSLGLVAMTAHWEFAYGPKVFKERAAELNYPMLACNVREKETGTHYFQPYKIVEIEGLRLGIIGSASNIVDKTMPASFSEGLTFSLGKEELTALVEKLRQTERVDLIIQLSHLGFPQDLKLLSEVGGVDICLSGHTHNRLYRPAMVGKTIVIQSGSQGSFLGKLDIEVENGRIANYQHTLIEVEPSVVPDKEVEAMVDETLKPFRQYLEQVVGRTETPLNRNTCLESTFDNLLLSAVLEGTGAELAFSNGWRFGAPIIPGNITLNHLYNMVPMDPVISMAKVKGVELIEMLEENLERTFAPDPYNQLGGYVKRGMGLQVYFKLENPKGQRIQQIFVGNEEVKPDRVYTTAYITEQGVPRKYGSDHHDLSLHTIEALKNYLAKHSPVNLELNGSFVVV